MLTNAELAILSLVAEKPRHGYQIEQLIEERAMRRWTEIGFSSIYRILKKLEKQGYIEGKLGEAQGRGPARMVYHITSTGHKAWEAASLEALSTPVMTHSYFLLGLDNIYELDPQEALYALDNYKEQLILSRESLTDHLKTQTNTHFYYRSFFDYMINMFSAEVEWIDKFIKEMEAFTQNEGSN